MGPPLVSRSGAKSCTPIWFGQSGQSLHARARTCRAHCSALVRRRVSCAPVSRARHTQSRKLIFKLAIVGGPAERSSDRRRRQPANWRLDGAAGQLGAPTTLGAAIDQDERGADDSGAIDCSRRRAKFKTRRRTIC